MTKSRHFLISVMVVNFARVYVTAEVKSVQILHEALNEVLSEDNMGFNAKNMSFSDVSYGTDW